MAPHGTANKYLLAHCHFEIRSFLKASQATRSTKTNKQTTKTVSLRNKAKSSVYTEMPSGTGLKVFLRPRKKGKGVSDSLASKGCKITLSH